MTSTAERGGGDAARSPAARRLGWVLAIGSLAAAAVAAATDASMTVALGIAAGGLLAALALSAALEQRARDRLRASWRDRLRQLADDLAVAVDDAEPFETIPRAAARARAGGEGPPAMAEERAAFDRSVADQCTQALGWVELQESRRQALADLELLARASSALAASLDVQRVAATLEELVVPLLADACSLHVPPGRGSGGQDGPPGNGATTDGRCCTIPLRAHGEVVGDLTIYRHARAVSASERASVQMLAEPAARALAHALRFSEQVHTSDTLQHSLLPEAILPVPNLEVAARYLAATEGQAVGGDF